jgi:hypothetical protein
MSREVKIKSSERPSLQLLALVEFLNVQWTYWPSRPVKPVTKEIFRPL